jgi:hypothetical protein
MTKQTHRTTTHAKGSRRRRLSQATIQLISDGVVASYIHDISTRHRAPRPAIDQTVKQFA